MKLELAFINYYGQKILNIIEAFGTITKPKGFQDFNFLSDFKSLLKFGKSQVTFPREIEDIIEEANLRNVELSNCITKYLDAVQAASVKFKKHWDNQENFISFFKCIRVIDPKQKAGLSQNILDYNWIVGYEKVSHGLFLDWSSFWTSIFEIETDFDNDFWNANEQRFPSMAKIGKNYIWLPPSGADVERSFSLLNLVSNPKLNQFTETDWRDLLLVYCNSKCFFKEEIFIFHFFHSKQKIAEFV